MAINEDDKPTPRLGTLPENIKLKPARGTDNAKDSGPLIGGEDSSAIGSFVGSVASGLGSVVSSPFEAIDRALAAAAGVEYRPEVASPIGKLGQGIEGAVEAVAAPDPERAEDFSTKLGAGLGSAAGFALPFAAAGSLSRIGQAALSSSLGATTTGVEQATDYESARKAAGLPVDKNDQQAAFFYGLLPGTLESVPLAKMFGRLDNVAKGGLQAAIKNTAKGTAEEALQEGVQSVASNLIASDVVRYDQDRGMFFDTPEAAAVGGGVGFILNAALSAVGLRQRGKYQDLAEQVSVDQGTEGEGVDPKINPLTGEEFENAAIAKQNKLIQRYTKLAAKDEQNRPAYEARIKELKDELRAKFLTEEASVADRQEATDVITGIAVREEEAVGAEAEPFPKAEGIQVKQAKASKKAVEEFRRLQEEAAGIAPAEPFPARGDITVRDIKGPKKLAEYFQQLETARTEPFPEAEGIDVTDLTPTEEITLDTVAADPATTVFLSDRPENTLLADALVRVAEQRKRRDETDAAFRARKDAEIAEAYRQRELQLADETIQEDIQQATAQSTDAPTQEQTKETIQRIEEQTGVDITEEVGRLNELFRRQAGFADIQVDPVQAIERQAGFTEDLPSIKQPPLAGTDLPKFLQDRSGIPAPLGVETDARQVQETATTDGDVQQPEVTEEGEVGRLPADQGRQEVQEAKKEVTPEEAQAFDLARGPRQRQPEPIEEKIDFGPSGLTMVPFDQKKPFTGALHSVRNIEDVGTIIDQGLKETTNVGGPQSQAVGGGPVTLEYDPADLKFNLKPYQKQEGVIYRQTKAKPKRILIDISDVATREAQGGAAAFDRVYEEVQEVIPAGVDMDDVWSDAGGYIAVLADGTYSEKNAEYNELSAKYGSDVADIIKANADELAAAMDNPDGAPAYTIDDYVRDTMARLPLDVPVYTYEVNEDGQPINVQEVPREEITGESRVEGTVDESNELVEEFLKLTGEAVIATDTQKKAYQILTKQMDAAVTDNDLRTMQKVVDRMRKLASGQIQLSEPTVEPAPAPETPAAPTTITALPEGYVGTKAGKPFKSERAAKGNRTKNGLSATHDVVQVEGGWALAPNDRPLPVKEPTAGVLQDFIDNPVEPPVAKAAVRDIDIDKISPKQALAILDSGVELPAYVILELEKKSWQEPVISDTIAPKDKDYPARDARYTPKESKVEPTQIDADLYEAFKRVGGRILVASDKGALRPGDPAKWIKEEFGTDTMTLEEFTQIYTGIQNGTIVSDGNTISTPVGVVETTEEVATVEPAEVPATTTEEVNGSLDTVEARLDAIDIEIADLEAELDSGYAENPSSTKKQIARLKREQRELEESQSSLHGEAQTIAKQEQDELVMMTQTTEVIEDPEADFLPESKKAPHGWTEVAGQRTPVVTPSEVAMTRRVVQKFWNSVTPESKKKLEIYVVQGVNDIPSKYKHLRDLYEKQGRAGALGHHFSPNIKNTNSVVFIYPSAGKTEEQIQWTLFHEVVGHYGFKRMFNQGWNQFMELALKNKDLAAKALAMRDRWTNIDLTPKDGEITMDVQNKYTYSTLTSDVAHHRFSVRGLQDRPVETVSKAGMIRLMDEYIAEIAANMSKQTFRDAAKPEQTFLKRVVAWIRHFFRKSGFGRISSKISDADLLAFVGESYTRITGDGTPVEDHIVSDVAQAKTNQAGLARMTPKEILANTAKSAVRDLKNHSENVKRRAMFEIDDPFAQSPAVSLSSYSVEAQAAIDETIQQAVQAQIVKTPEEARTILEAIRDRKGRIDNSNHARRIEAISDRIRRSRAGRILSSTGHLNEPRVLSAIESITKGGIERGQMVARRFAQKTKNLNDIQKQAIYNYFKTKDASVNDIPVSDEIRRLSRDTKQYIEDLGESLVHLGLLRRETWEADRGSYLSIRYWKYIQNFYASGGKKLSLKNYLKKQKGLSDVEKQALGEIKDPSFIVPETVATISRDVSLHSMFQNLLTMDQVGGLGWVLGDSQFVTVEDKRMKLSDIETNIENLEMLQESDEGVSPLWQDQQGKEEIERQLNLMYAAKEEAEQNLTNEIAAILQERGEEVTPERLRQTLKAEFVQVKDKRYGPLYNKYIRKELYEEIVDSGDMYNKEHTDFMGRWFGVGGHGEKAHQIWKASKVVLNPPSWARNAVGNMVLLDIGSNTNTVKLMKMVAAELNAWRAGNPSKYFHYAHEQGLWNTTFSASELNLMSDQFQDKFKTEVNLDNTTNLFKKMWWMTHNKFFNAMEVATNIYGGMEGFFKTVALRDHIEQWERQNGMQLERAPQNVQEAVIREAAETANKNIFDYSKVPGWMRTMRRMPFVGAPFLTYTFKAIPQSVESLASRPHKFIKYAAFPYVMAQWFMMENDMDDEDFEKLKRDLPKWQKEQSSVFLLPYKDANGKWQTMDFGYYLPWAAMHNTALQISHTFDTGNPFMSGLEAGKKSMMDLGFLGGPLPNMISALITNKDPFMGNEIVRTAGTAGDKTNDFMRYLVDLWTPTFLTSKGVLGRTLDNMGLEPTPFNAGRQFSATGADRETAFQTALRGVGVNVRGFDPRESVASKIKSYRFEKRKLETARRTIFKDRNLSTETKARKAKEINEQIKLLNQKHREELHGERDR